MKKIIIVILLLVSSSIFSQSDSKWKIGFEYSLDNLSMKNDEGSENLILGSYSGYIVDYDKVNYSLGLLSQYSINDKMSLISGLFYSNKDFTGMYYCETCQTTDFLLGIQPERIEQQFLVIPLEYQYFIYKGKFSPNVNIGINNNFEIKNSLEELSNGYFLEATLGASINYSMANKWEINLGYNYQSSITKLYKSDDIKLRNNSFYLKLLYSLNK